MEQHPVPQHIASYEFRLVGDMTLRQFGMLAGCCLVALVFYAAHIPPLFKWPLVILFIFLGVGFAFFPIEERPLHQWFIAFFRAVYSPTYFLWKKQVRKLEILTPSFTPKVALPSSPPPPPDEKQLTQFLQTLPEQKSPLEEKEELFLKRVDSLFQTSAIPVAPTFPPGLTVSPPTFSSFLKNKPKTSLPKDQPVFMGKKVALPPTESVLPPSPAGKPDKELAKTKPDSETLPQPPPKPIAEARISPYLPFPQMPKTPNLLVGMILDEDGKMLENAIIEIRNSQGIPVRALKTNRLGQFRIVTPLANDTYEIETEKEGYSFDIIKIKLEGNPVSPIEIRTK